MSCRSLRGVRKWRDLALSMQGNGEKSQCQVKVASLLSPLVLSRAARDDEERSTSIVVNARDWNRCNKILSKTTWIKGRFHLAVSSGCRLVKNLCSRQFQQSYYLNWVSLIGTKRSIIKIPSSSLSNNFKTIAGPCYLTLSRTLV